MPRRPQPWQRSDRPGWRVWLNGKQVFLGLEKSEAFREWHRLLSLEVPTEPSKLTVEALADRYLVEREPELALPTYRGKLYALQSWVNSYGAMRAADLRPFHVTAWLAEQSTWGQATKHQCASVIKTWAAWCVQEGYLETDRLRSVRIAGGKPRKPAQPGDLERLIEATDDSAFRDFLVVLGDTGCRPGEIRSLEATRIDFKTSTAIVRGKRGQRVVGLTKRAAIVLRHYAKQYQVGVILRNGQSMPWTASTIKRRLDAACKLAGVEHFVPYHCRHDLARRLVKAGVDSLLIAKQYGHADLKMLSSTYFHPEASDLADAVEAAVESSAKPARAHASSRRAGRRTKR